MKPNSKEFFSNHDPLYRTYGKQEALRKQDELFAAHPPIERDWLAYNADLKAMSNFSRYAAAPFGDPEAGDSFTLGRAAAENRALHTQWRKRRAQAHGYADPAHPFARQGSADLNSYKLFTELAHALLQPGGRLGLIIPSGIYTDKGTTDLRALFLDHCRWDWLFGFENRDGIFDIHRSFKFCPIIVTKGGQTAAINAAFTQRDLAAWETAEKRAIPYRAEQVSRFSPATRAILEVPTAADLAILEKLYANGVLLGDDSPAGWGIQYAREFDMTNDSSLFPPRPQREAQGYRPDEYGHWLKGNWQPAAGLAPAAGLIRSRDGQTALHVEDVEDVALPLYQGGMIHQFDFCKRSWISGTGLRAVWEELPWDEKAFSPQFLISQKSYVENERVARGLKIAFRNIARTTDARTFIGAILPDIPCGNALGIFYSLRCDLWQIIAGLDSFTFDWNLRQRVGGTNLNWYIMEETPLLSPKQIKKSPALAQTIAGLSFAAPYFAREWLKLYPQQPAVPWRQLWAVTPAERLRLRCMLDAVVAHLYGLSPADFGWVLRDCDHPVEQTRNNAFTRALDPKGFWRVDKEQPPELRHPVLAQIAFAELQSAGLEAFLAQNNGDGWQLPESVRLSDYGLGHDERAREAQQVAAALGPRWLPWQLAQSAEESWAECARHAENLRLLLGPSSSQLPGSSELPGSSNPNLPIFALKQCILWPPALLILTASPHALKHIYPSNSEHAPIT